jgi:hypothetical protein
MLEGVGPIRAMRMRRDLDVERVREVSRLSLGDLQEVWSVGPYFARVIKGSAQGHVSRMKSEVDGTIPTVALFIPKMDVKQPHSMFDEDELEELGIETDEIHHVLDVFEEHIACQLITSSLRQAGYDPSEDAFEVLYVENAWSSQIVEAWYDRCVQHNLDIKLREYETPWDRFHSDNKYMAVEFRNRDMLRTSKSGVIVADGMYTGKIRQVGYERNITVETGFDVHGDIEDSYAISYSRSDGAETRRCEIDDVESMFRTANKYVGIGADKVDQTHNRIEADGADDDELLDDDELSVQEVGGYEPDDTPEDDLGEDARLELEDEDLPDGFTLTPSSKADEDSRIDYNDIAMGADPGGGLKHKYYDSLS